MLNGLRPPSGATGRISAGIRLRNADEVGTGANRERVPCLGGIVHAIGIVGGGVVGPRIRVADVARGHDEQTGIGAVAVEVNRKRINCRRPSGRAPPDLDRPEPLPPSRIPFVRIGAVHFGPSHPLPPSDNRGDVDLRPGMRFPRNQLDRFETVLDFYGISSGE